LFRAGWDFLVARDGEHMIACLRELLHDPARADALAASGLETILRRHTCRHRVEELLGIVAQVRGASVTPALSLLEAAP
jgi:spore maturation protein CgeB